MSDEAATEDADGTAGRSDRARGVSIGVLGQLALVDGAGAVTSGSLGGPKQRLVLAALVCEVGRVVPVDQLAAAVWGDDVDDGARRSLRSYVSRLRTALDGVATIENRHGGYVLGAEDLLTDAARFEQLVEEATGLVDSSPDEAARSLEVALSLWRGPPFGDLTGQPALAAETTRLEQLRLRAVELVAGIRIDRGEHAAQVPELSRLVLEHPLREPLRRLLMLALYRSGRQGEALEEFERARAVLAAELGVDPSEELQALHTAILRRDAALDPPGDVLPASPGGGPGGAPDGPLAPSAAGAREFVGRDAELEEVVGLVRAAAAWRPSVLLVGGPAGIGKSRLLTEAGAVARRDGADVLVGRCIELGDAAVPFAPVAQVFRRITRSAAPADIEGLLGPTRPELARIVPELGEVSAARDGAEVSGRLFAAALDALGRLGRRGPLMVVLEDVHWADRSTLDLVGFLARNVDRERLLLAATYRTDELHRRHPLRLVLGELLRQPSVVRLELGPLGREDVATLTRDVIGADADAGLVEDVIRRSAGNPFYARELATASRDGGAVGVGAGLRDVIASRLVRLPEDSYALLEVVAVAGGSIDQRLLADIVGERPAELARRLRPAVDLHVLEAEEALVRFHHDLVREVVTDDLLPGQRGALHASIATALAAAPSWASGGADHVDAELVHHWREAREDQRAFEASLRAAAAARRAGAYAEAFALSEQALELWRLADHDTAPDRHVLLQQAAANARLAGHYRRGVALMREALADAGADRGREAELRCALAMTLVLDARDRVAAMAEAERALDLVVDDPPSSLKARVLHAVARVHIMRGDHGEGRRIGEQAVTVARAAGDEVIELDARVTEATAVAAGSAASVAAEGLAELEELLGVAESRGDAEVVGRIHNNIVAALRYGVDPDPAALDVAVRRAMAWLEQPAARELVLMQAYIRNNVARAALTLGDVDRAMRQLEGLDERALQGKHRVDVVEARARILWFRGRLDEARREATAMLALEVDDRERSDWARTILALVAAESGDLDEVRRQVERHRSLTPVDYDETGGRWRTMRLLRVLVRAEVDAALAAGATGTADAHRARADDTLAVIEELHDTVRAAGAAAMPRTRHGARAELLLARAERSRDGERSAEAWRAAVDHGGLWYDLAYARWRLAEVVLARGDRDEAVALLDAAHSTATSSGADLLASRVARTASAHGIDLGDAM